MDLFFRGFEVPRGLQQCWAPFGATILDVASVKMGQVWTSLDEFRQVWTSLDEFRQVWTNLDKFGQVWTKLDKFGQVWTSLDTSGIISFKYRER